MAHNGTRGRVPVNARDRTFSRYYSTYWAGACVAHRVCISRGPCAHMRAHLGGYYNTHQDAHHMGATARTQRYSGTHFFEVLFFQFSPYEPLNRDP